MLNTTNTATTTYAQLQKIYTRWLVGDNLGVSVADLPSDFAEILQACDDDKHDLFCLALASQFQSLMYLHTPTGKLNALPVLPTLDKLTVLPKDLQPLARRILKNMSNEHYQHWYLFLRLLANRGYALPPTDCLDIVSALQKRLDDKIPIGYLPWLNWLNGDKSGQAIDDEVNGDNWDEWYPAERAKRLKQMRNTNAKGVLELFDTHFGKHPADERLRLLECMAVNLSLDDETFLRGLLSDRSQKVANLARQFLARLGSSDGTQGGTDAEKEQFAKELAEMFELKTNPLNKRYLAPKKLKSGKQISIRTEQLKTVHLPYFAKAFGLSITELIQLWEFRGNDYRQENDNLSLVQNMTATLTDADFAVLVEQLCKQLKNDNQVYSLIVVLEKRLDEPLREMLTKRLLHIGAEFENIANYASEQWVFDDFDKLMQSPSWKSLSKRISDCHWIGVELYTLSMMVSQQVARALFDKLIEMGVPRTDNGLMVLNLNQRLREVEN